MTLAARAGIAAAKLLVTSVLAACRRIPPWMMFAGPSTATPGSSDQAAAPVLADAASRLTAAASLFRTFVNVCWQLQTTECALEGDHHSVLQQLATGIGGLRQQHQHQTAQQIAAAAIGSGMAAGAAQAAARVVSLLVARGPQGVTRPLAAPDMLCLEADMLAYSC